MWDPITNLLIGLGLELFFGITGVVSDEVTAYREAEMQRPCAWGEARSSVTKRCEAYGTAAGAPSPSPWRDVRDEPTTPNSGARGFVERGLIEPPTDRDFFVAVALTAECEVERVSAGRDPRVLAFAVKECRERAASAPAAK
jgi:hypothetical protein